MKQPQDISFLQHFLADRDEKCPACDYNLRGLLSDQCPECGEALVLRVGLEHPKMKLLITGLIGLACGAGLNGLLMIYVLIEIIGEVISSGFDLSVFDLAPYMVPFAVYNAVGLLIEGGMLALWLFFWRRIARYNLTTRSFLTMGCWVMTLINIILFSFVVD